MDQRGQNQDQPDYGQPPQFGEQTQGAQPYGQSGWQAPPAAGQPKKNTKLGCGCLGALALVVVIVVAVAVGSGKSGTSSSGTSTTETTTASPASTATDDSYTSVPILPVPETTQAAVAAQVTYACTGHAPDGVDITYGPSGSQYSASKLPFKKTAVLDDSAQYYVTEAQLSGSGSVTCTTTIQTSDGTQTVNTASAQGGYGIASAQICSSFDGGWDKC